MNPRNKDGNTNQSSHIRGRWLNSSRLIPKGNFIPQKIMNIHHILSVSVCKLDHLKIGTTFLRRTTFLTNSEENCKKRSKNRFCYLPHFGARTPCAVMH